MEEKDYENKYHPNNNVHMEGNTPSITDQKAP